MMMDFKKPLIFDVSNVLFRVAAVQKHKDPYLRDATPQDLVGLCMHVSLQSIMKWYTKFRPDYVVFAFDGPNNWRKKYTAETKARLAYKGNRVQDPEMVHYYQMLSSFKEVMSSHTSIACLNIESMEADDAIAGFCQLYADPDRKIYIVSGDKDMVGLLKLPNVFLVNPDNGKLRNQKGDKDYEEDIDYWTFRKCIRGDMGDYVPSAYPRVRETKIKAAYLDQYERANFMNVTWKDENGLEHRVGDLYEQNKILLDLFSQPQEIREKLLEGVKDQTVNVNKYSHFHFLRFLDKYDLRRVREEAIKFVDLFSNNQRALSGTQRPVEEPKEKTEPAKQKGLLEF